MPQGSNLRHGSAERVGHTTFVVRGGPLTVVLGAFALLVLMGYLSAGLSRSSCEMRTRERLDAEHHWPRGVRWIEPASLVRIRTEHRAAADHGESGVRSKLFRTDRGYASKDWQPALESVLEKPLLEGFTVPRVPWVPWVVRVHFGYFQAAGVQVSGARVNTAVIVNGVATYLSCFGASVELDFHEEMQVISPGQ